MPIRHAIHPTDPPPVDQTQRNKHAKRVAIRTILFRVLGALLACGLVGFLFLAAVLAWYSRELPDPNALLQRDVPQSTKIFDRTGQVLLYEIHGSEKRTLVKIDEIPRIMREATISVEDKTFYEHHGVNVRRVIGALIADILSGRKAQGASTLTQQFVKNAILTNEKSWSRKLKELILALQIERLYTKDQILQLYFNEIPYGSTLYGVESASRSYFGKHVSDITLDEAALLAALPQAPDTYSPYGTGARGDNRKALVQRQHRILDLMAEQKYITQQQADDAKQVDTLKKLLPKSIGQIHAPHFVMYIRSQLIEKYGQHVVEQGGLKVTTTLDWKLEQIAEEEIKNGVEARGPRYQFTNASLVAIDPKTGQIMSMVGSKNFFDQENDGQVNVSLQPRQPGSSFKPIVFLAGFIKGYTPSMTLWDVNTTFKTDLKDYQPKNYDLKEHGPISARMALQGSLNIPAVKMLYLVGVGNVLDFAEQLGYTTLKDRSRFGLSLVLGGGEVRLLEHTRTYATFANSGKAFPLTSILKVEDAMGNTLEEWKPSDGIQVVDPSATHALSNVLSDNGARTYVFGVKNYLTLPNRPAATKTGTTNNFHDAWTMGYTPSLAAGVWVGNNDNREMKRGADGSQIAAPIWQAFMTRALQGTPVESFPQTTSSTTNKPYLLGQVAERVVKIDKISGKLATEFTPPQYIEERVVHEAHSELWYIDRDNPQGPPPQNPQNDPQFSNWESGVQDWVKRTAWNVTSTMPIEMDDVHTAQNTPIVSILSPSQNATISTRDLSVSLSVNAPRTISRYEALLDSQLVGSSLGGVTTFPIHIPNNIGIGFHDLTLGAYDDVGNYGTSTHIINLVAEPANGGSAIHILQPTNGALLQISTFPVYIRVQLEAPGATKLEVFSEDANTGDTRLVTSIVPETGTNDITWHSSPLPGVYRLYATVTKSDTTLETSPKIDIRVQ